MKFPEIQYISSGETPNEHVNSILRACEAGVQWVQLRLKSVNEHDLLNYALQVRKIADRFGAVFILNDNVQIAHAGNADGVHLGRHDMSPRKAREIMGKDKIIGGTANAWDDIVTLQSAGVDYIGLGPFKFTQTKKDLSPVLGLERLAYVLKKAHENELHTPVYAIGGIERADVEPVMAAGAYGIAVSGVITRSGNKKELIAELKSSIASGKKLSPYAKTKNS